MFTGIVQTVGHVRHLAQVREATRLLIHAPDAPFPARPGDSICVAGCCLTLVDLPESHCFAFDVVPETLRATTLGSLAPGAAVNLEPAATPATALGGHFLLGHVDAVGHVLDVTHADEYRIRIAAPPAVMPAVVPKGSIAVDGVSLTIAQVDPAAGWFEVALVPATLQRTTLASLAAGQRCNLETDIIARTVIHWLRHFATTR